MFFFFQSSKQKIAYRVISLVSAGHLYHLAITRDNINPRSGDLGEILISKRLLTNDVKVESSRTVVRQ